MSTTHHAADEPARRRRHCQTLVNEGYSAEDIAYEGAAFGEETLAAEALRTMHPYRFPKRDESAQMDKYRMQEQARYLHTRLSQGAVAADLVLCMHAKGEGLFAEHVLQKLEEKELLSLLAQEEEEEKKEHKKRSVPSPTEDKPSPTEDRLLVGQEEQKGGGTQEEEEGQESALEHPCSGVFSVKHICVVASRAHWSEIKSLPELSL